MKSVKMYLIVASVLLFSALGSGIYVWYVVQKLNTSASTYDKEEIEIKNQTPPDISAVRAIN